MVLVDNGSTVNRRVQAYLTVCLSTCAPPPGRLVEFSDTDPWLW